jgi:hypothetical protein
MIRVPHHQWAESNIPVPLNRFRSSWGAVLEPTTIKVFRWKLADGRMHPVLDLPSIVSRQATVYQCAFWPYAISNAHNMLSEIVWNYVKRIAELERSAAALSEIQSCVRLLQTESK